MNPLLKVDFYKPHHFFMYVLNMTKLYSNFTPRKSRMKGVDSVVVFGIQHFVLEYLLKDFNDNFFSKSKEEIINEYKRHIALPSYEHVEKLHDLQYLPIELKALDEGTLCPIGVPMMTITNTHPDFAWLVNYLETLISCMLWQPMTSATIAHEYKKLLTKYAVETTGNAEGVQWQGHDFSMRGMSSVESAILSGMGHLLSFTGTDTIPAIYQLETSYNAVGLIGASVPATEHSVMCMGTKESEIATFKRLLDLYPTGILSVVSDTWDLWKVCTEYLPALKSEIMARDGKLVIRPDSGDPVDIICGYEILTQEQVEKFVYSSEYRYTTKGKCIEKDGKLYPIYVSAYPDGSIIEFYADADEKQISLSEQKGVIELLWDVFGGTVNEQGYKVLNSHIGAIYGDSITLDRAAQICERLKAKGFASTCIVLGIGSYTYQYNTRDTFGFAMKATYGEITHTKACSSPEQCTKSEGYCEFECGEPKQVIEPREIFKDPITDDGTKKSKKGLLKVCYDGSMETYSKLGRPADGTIKPIICKDQQTWEQEQQGLLTTVFKDGVLIKTTTLEEIRNRLCQ